MSPHNTDQSHSGNIDAMKSSFRYNETIKAHCQYKHKEKIEMQPIRSVENRVKCDENRVFAIEDEKRYECDWLMSH